MNKGAVTEAFVGQELLAYSNYLSKKQLFYWVREKRGASAEVDYLESVGNKIVPIEVKSGTAGNLKSINQFLKEKEDSEVGYHFSQRNFSENEKIRSVPLYAVWKIFESTE